MGKWQRPSEPVYSGEKRGIDLASVAAGTGEKVMRVLSINDKVGHGSVPWFCLLRRQEVQLKIKKNFF